MKEQTAYPTSLDTKITTEPPYKYLTEKMKKKKNINTLSFWNYRLTWK